MTKLSLALFLLATPASAAGPFLAAAPSFKRPYRIDAAQARVVDGDTIAYKGKSFRLYGFDAPELRGKCAYEKAKAGVAKLTLRELMDGAKRVQVQRSRAPDKYGRIVARLIVDKKDVGPLMIEKGMAVAYLGKGPRKDWCHA